MTSIAVKIRTYTSYFILFSPFYSFFFTWSFDIDQDLRAKPTKILLNKTKIGQVCVIHCFPVEMKPHMLRMLLLENASSDCSQDTRYK